ncbi:hypothetical protein NL676_038845 [Syzygium grande]|nr:hypothetical protein NL676_038845 [Syzygium grande]
MSATYLGGFSGDMKREFTGIPNHEMTHVWQWDRAGQAPDRLIEGIADFMRLRNGFVAELNKKMKTGYGDDYFVDLLGKTVDQLWSQCKAKYAT